LTKAVILAAGKSTRTYPLTLTTPKPLLKVANKTLLQHNLEQLDGLVDEVIIVIGYKKEMIKQKFKDSFQKLKLTYVEQKEQLGTGNALMTVRPYLNDSKDFIVLMGDDLYSKDDIKKIIKKKYSVLSKEVIDPSNFGVFIVHNNKVKDLIEKPQLYTSKHANTGLYLLDNKIFEILEKLDKTKRNEYELTDGVRKLAQNNEVFIIEANFWIPIGYPWDLLIADNELRKGNIIGQNTKINGKVENSSIGDNCIIDGTIKNSIIMDNTTIKENSMIENSIIGNNVIFSGIIKSEKGAKSIVKKISITVENLGAIIGDNVNAENVTIKAGSKIWPNLHITGKITGDVHE